MCTVKVELLRIKSNEVQPWIHLDDYIKSNSKQNSGKGHEENQTRHDVHCLEVKSGSIHIYRQIYPYD